MHERHAREQDGAPPGPIGFGLRDLGALQETVGLRGPAGFDIGLGRPQGVLVALRSRDRGQPQEFLCSGLRLAPLHELLGLLVSLAGS